MRDQLGCFLLGEADTVKQIYSKKPSRAVNPDETVAVGVAVNAGVFKGDVKDIFLLDVAPLPLGIETFGGMFTRLVLWKNVTPTKKSLIFSTAADNLTQVDITVFSLQNV